MFIVPYEANLTEAIEMTSQGPTTYNSEAPEYGIDGSEDTTAHTDSLDPPEIHWWKATFKTTVYLTSFTIVPRKNCCQDRINNMMVYSVTYNKGYDKLLF